MLAVSPKSKSKRRSIRQDPADIDHHNYANNSSDAQESSQVSQGQVKKIAKSLVTGWSILRDSEIAVKMYSGGTTNKLFRCSIADPSTHSQLPSSILVRFYGENTEKIIDREKEERIVKELQKAGLDAAFYGKFSGGCVYKHVKGKALVYRDLRLEKHWSKVIPHMAEWHSIPIFETDPMPAVLKNMHTFLREAAWIYETPTDQETKNVLARLANLNLDFNIEIQKMKQMLEQTGDRQVFSHNDLTCGNIIWNEQSEAKVSFIDFEYAGTNPRGYDLANHICEWAGLELNWDCLPSHEQEMELAALYLKSSGESVTQESQRSFHAQVKKLTLASHLSWGLWGLVQIKSSSIEFDYVGYTFSRLEKYLQDRDTLLALPL